MRLYLVRHGDAEPKKTDPNRPLTPAGVEETEKVAHFLQPLKLSAEDIWHSGKTRAAQTAGIIAKAFVTGSAAQQHDGLDPEDPVGPIAREFEVRNVDLVIVGHLPFLSSLISELLIGDPEVDLVDFAKSAVVCLDHSGEDDVWSLLWMVTPDLCGPA